MLARAAASRLSNLASGLLYLGFGLDRLHRLSVVVITHADFHVLAILPPIITATVQHGVESRKHPAVTHHDSLDIDCHLAPAVVATQTTPNSASDGSLEPCW